jgi:transketolase
MHSDLDQRSVATIRTLAMDAVQKARSGHPGTPMALASVAYVLWQRFLRYDPTGPIWPNRDRFVLGRLSVEMEDIRAFRQLGSKCPGHPEYRCAAGRQT